MYFRKNRQVELDPLRFRGELFDSAWRRFFGTYSPGNCPLALGTADNHDPRAKPRKNR